MHWTDREYGLQENRADGKARALPQKYSERERTRLASRRVPRQPLSSEERRQAEQRLSERLMAAP